MRLIPGRQSPAGGGGVAALEESDLAAINEWLCVTRLRTVLVVVLGLPLLTYAGGLDLRWLPVTAVCAATAALSPLYRRWMARGGDLRALVYAQLVVDTLAIGAGLLALGRYGPLFRYFFLMTIVPATMVSGTCAVVITALSAVCYGALLFTTPLDAVHSATPAGLFVVVLFVLAAVANQCFFYKQHLRDKNRDLAVASRRLAETNAELSVTAETALGLLEVARAVGTSLDLGVVIDRLHAVALDRLKTDWCATLLVDPASPGGYRFLAGRGLGGAAPPIGQAFWELGATVAAEELVEVPDVRSGPAALRGWPVASGLFAVMRCGNRAAGVFATGSRERTGRFASFQHELAVGVATQAAVAIEKATLHAKQREEGEISAALLQVAELMNANLEAENVLDRLTALGCRVTGCDWVNVLLYDAERRTFRIAAGTDTRAPQSLDEARHLEMEIADFPILEEASRAGCAESWEGDGRDLVGERWMRRWSLRAVLAAPLTLRGEVIGALAAGWHERGGPFPDKIRRLVRGLAHQAVTALENNRLVRNLRAANNLKSEFIGTMSHELRTPLNAIIGYNELLAEGQFGALSAEQRHVCAKILESSRQLLELIQATLDVSRMESGAMPVALGPVDVRALLGEVRSQVPSGWIKDGVRLSFEVDPDLPVLESDRGKLKMVVRNLVHNALKFTDAGSVVVSARIADGGGTLAISVADTGIGISQEGQAIIFEMFRQVDGSDRRRHDGVGLGLYIVRRLTALLGGTLTVESEVGRGSTFHLHLPLGAAARRLASLAPAAVPI
jgi:signal transduction histidine kinase